MKRLLTIDAADYTDDMPVYVKHTVRAIIEKDGKYAMQQSGTGEYKIPGGGVENGESHEETLEREVLEETGRDIFETNVKYECHTYFYYCDVEDKICDVCMTESEIEKGFHPVWAAAEDIIAANRRIGDAVTSNRDTSFMELLMNNNL